jgi:hypothetical protein
MLNPDSLEALRANAARSHTATPIRVTLQPGQRVRVELEGTNGYFDITFDEGKDRLVTVYASEPDDLEPRRVSGEIGDGMVTEPPAGIIYAESFVLTEDLIAPISIPHGPAKAIMGEILGVKHADGTILGTPAPGWNVEEPNAESIPENSDFFDRYNGGAP